MEAWKDELYHYGVKNMKWGRKKNGNAIAENLLSDARELSQDRHWTDDKKYKKWSQKKELRLRRNARAIENGRPGIRRKSGDANSLSVGKGLYRRGSGLGNSEPVSGGYNSRKSITEQKSFQRTRKKKAAKFVKRVLS